MRYHWTHSRAHAKGLKSRSDGATGDLATLFLCTSSRVFCERLDNLSLIYTFVFWPNLRISSPFSQLFGATCTLISPDRTEDASPPICSLSSSGAEKIRCKLRRLDKGRGGIRAARMRDHNETGNEQRWRRGWRESAKRSITRERKARGTVMAFLR